MAAFSATPAVYLNLEGMVDDIVVEAGDHTVLVFGDPTDLGDADDVDVLRQLHWTLKPAKIDSGAC